MPEYITLTPTWTAAVRIYIECIKHGDNEHAKQEAEKELLKLAAYVDNLQGENDDER